MNIINMFDDYAEMCEAAKHEGKFAAYKKYTEKYPSLFDGVLK